MVYEQSVPIEREVVKRSTRKEWVRGSRMVERHGTKQVTEMQVEYRDKEV